MTIAPEDRREQLLGIRTRLTAAISRLHEGDTGGDELSSAQGDQHPADHASILLDHEIEESIEGSVENVVRAIDDALARIEAGAYGVCAACGKPIPEARLDAVPYATLCIEDKRAEERR